MEPHMRQKSSKKRNGERAYLIGVVFKGPLDGLIFSSLGGRFLIRHLLGLLLLPCLHTLAPSLRLIVKRCLLLFLWTRCSRHTSAPLNLGNTLDYQMLRQCTD